MSAVRWMLSCETVLKVWAGVCYFINIYSNLESLWIPERKCVNLLKDSFSGFDLQINDCFYYSHKKRKAVVVAFGKRRWGKINDEEEVRNANQLNKAIQTYFKMRKNKKMLGIKQTKQFKSLQNMNFF